MSSIMLQNLSTWQSTTK